MPQGSVMPVAIANTDARASSKFPQRSLSPTRIHAGIRLSSLTEHSPEMQSYLICDIAFDTSIAKSNPAFIQIYVLTHTGFEI
jgi:hypothetical protein